MPWEHSGTEVTLREGLRVQAAEPSEEPITWGIQLTSGQRCYHTQGAVSAVGGVPIRFFCTSNKPLVLLGKPDKMPRLWTIREIYIRGRRFGYHFEHGPLGRTAVAWYGVGAAT